MGLFLLGLITSFALVGVMVVLANKLGLMDKPGPRSSHVQATPTGAGLALIASLWLSSGLYPLLPFAADSSLFSGWQRLLLLPASVLCVVGFVDDLRPLSARLRFAVQLGATVYLMVFLNNEFAVSIWVALAGLVLLPWTMNAYNFMDGSNGMAGMQGVISGGLLSLCLFLAGAPGLGLAAAVVAGACAGFLPWNAPKARIFLGDAGSVPLGFLFTGLGLLAFVAGYLPLPVVLLMILVFYVDAGLTLLSRIRNKEQWYTAHRTHVYQRLIAKGWSHSQVLVLYLAINLVLIAPAMMLGTLHSQWSWEILTIVTVLLLLAWFSVSLRLGVDS